MKILFTGVALGAGFKGGEIVPTLTVGAAFGYLMSLVTDCRSDCAHRSEWHACS